jgi:hypothetical protein
MMTIYFKNNTSVTIDQNVANAIVQNLNKGATKFQVYSSSDENVFLIINMEEIVYIA